MKPEIQIGKTYLTIWGVSTTIEGRAKSTMGGDKLDLHGNPIYYSVRDHYDKYGKSINRGHPLIVQDEEWKELQQIESILKNIHEVNPKDKLVFVKDGIKALEKRANSIKKNLTRERGRIKIWS